MSVPTRRTPGPRTGGPTGNERLTALTGAALLVLLAVEGATILRIRALLVVHVFVGMLLLGPVALKLTSTTYRFTRYYLHAEPYRRKGPPHPVARALGPLVILSTLTVLGSGVALIATGQQHGGLLQLHKISFLGWLVVMTVHVLTYLRRLPALLAGDWHLRRSDRLTIGGRSWRLAAAIGSVIVGLLVAVATIRLGTTWLQHQQPN